MRKRIIIGLMALLVVLSGCDKQDTDSNNSENSKGEYGSVIQYLPLAINSFEYGELDNGHIRDVKFNISGGDGTYNYELTLGVYDDSDEIVKYITFAEGESKLGVDVSEDFSLEKIEGSYSKCILILDVWKKYGTLETSNQMKGTEYFSVENR